MSSKHPAFTALKTLREEFDLVHEGAIAGNGILHLDPESDRTAKKLQRDAIAYPINHGAGLHLHSAVIGLFRHYENRLDFRRHAGDLSNLREELQERASIYDKVAGGSPSLAQEYGQKVVESLYDITRRLQEICRDFAETIYQNLQNIPNLELRIQENKNVLAQLGRLNTTLDGFSPDALPDLYRNPALRPLVNTELSPALTAAYNILSPAADRFSETLMRWEKDLQNQKRNRLLDAIAHHFRSNPAYRPDYALFSEHKHHRRQPAQALFAYANIQHPDADAHYGEMATRMFARLEKPAAAAQKPANDVTDQRGQAPIAAPADPTDDCLDELFAALLAENGIARITAFEAYGKLQPPVGIDTWLLSVDLYYHRRQEEFADVLRIDYAQQINPRFSGSHVITGITLEKIQAP